MPKAYLVCPYCETAYNVNSSDLNSDGVYSCDECGSEITVTFFDCCPNCHENIGFYDNGKLKYDSTDLISDVVKGGIKGFLNPIEGVGMFFNSFKTKDSNGSGICPLCNSRFVRCTDCNELTEIPMGTEASETVKCLRCGQLLTPGYLEEGMGHKHSKEFYRH